MAMNNLMGVVYNSLSLGTFINSYNDRTWYLVVTRNIFDFHGFGVNYFAGLLYGYAGRLSTVRGIPLADTFLFKSDVNPIVSLETYYEVVDHLDVQLLITPLVALSGVKYNF